MFTYQLDSVLSNFLVAFTISRGHTHASKAGRRLTFFFATILYYFVFLVLFFTGWVDKFSKRCLEPSSFFFLSFGRRLDLFYLLDQSSSTKLPSDGHTRETRVQGAYTRERIPRDRANKSASIHLNRTMLRTSNPLSFVSLLFLFILGD